MPVKMLHMHFYLFLVGRIEVLYSTINNNEQPDGSKPDGDCGGNVKLVVAWAVDGIGRLLERLRLIFIYIERLASDVGDRVDTLSTYQVLVKVLYKYL